VGLSCLDGLNGLSLRVGDLGVGVPVVGSSQWKWAGAVEWGGSAPGMLRDLLKVVDGLDPAVHVGVGPNEAVYLLTRKHQSGLLNGAAD
jgi:hypothetical protein